MDLFQHRYYRLGKFLMSLIGQWPYQSIHARRGIYAVFILFIAYSVVDQIVTLVTYRHDWNILLECLVPNVFEALCAVKYLGLMRNSRNILKLLDRIRMDWKEWARHEEVKYLHEYAARGEKITIALTGKRCIVKGSSDLTNIDLSIFWIVVSYTATVFYNIQPMITKVIDIVLKNGTEPGRFPFPVVYYNLDVQKNYYYLIVYIATCALMVLSAAISSEVMLILYVQHVSGIFAALGHKLERIGNNDTSVNTESPYAIDKTDRVDLASCIDRHNDAIEYADLIRTSYVWNFFFTIVFGMILLIATGLQMLLKTHDLGATLTLAGLTLGIIFIFYMECFISQILINHSISIRFYIYNSRWYRLPPKTQKILQLMTMRCNLPCQLTAGNMLIMSVHSFGLSMRTAMSYFAFMRSMQGM